MTSARIPNLPKIACIVFMCCAATASSANFKRLATFNATDGAVPYAALIQATDGNFYGTTPTGGANLTDCGSEGCGTVFKITPAGKLTRLYSFCSQQNCTDGSQPVAGLLQATDGNFYGTTYSGGANDVQPCTGGCGTIFKITPAGTLTTLYSFCSLTNCADGAVPLGTLIQATDGNFYGTTSGGGANSEPFDGTVFKINPAGNLTTLYSFCSLTNCADGANPFAGVVQATDGNFYGTTQYGGTINACNGPCGTVFTITSGGSLTTLHSFDGTDGNYPVAGVIQASGGTFYGTTPGGRGTCCGTIFAITSGGTFSLLHTFKGTDGDGPDAKVIQATDGKFYGTTVAGGAHRYGTVYKITAGGTLTTLYSFDPPRTNTSFAGLVQAANGILYGTTAYGGQVQKCDFQQHFGGCGTVFRLSLGLGARLPTAKY